MSIQTKHKPDITPHSWKACPQWELHLSEGSSKFIGGEAGGRVHVGADRGKEQFGDDGGKSQGGDPETEETKTWCDTEGQGEEGDFRLGRTSGDEEDLRLGRINRDGRLLGIKSSNSSYQSLGTSH